VELEQIDHLAKQFKAIDKDGSGLINPDELRNAFDKMGLPKYKADECI
jgi:Ca2+-binding EF-hand superfamily protein